MKTTIKHVAPWLAAAAIGGAIALAPAASAATVPAPVAPSVVGSAGSDPLVPYGTNPQVPYRLGYVDSNHDEIDTTNGQVDVPF